MSINFGFCQGYTTSDGSLFQANGVAVYNNSIAINDRVKNEQVTYFYNFKVFGERAIWLSEHCKKGHYLSLVYKLTSNSYRKGEITINSPVLIIKNFTDHSVNLSNNNNNNNNNVAIQPGTIVDDSMFNDIDLNALDYLMDDNSGVDNMSNNNNANMNMSNNNNANMNMSNNNNANMNMSNNNNANMNMSNNNANMNMSNNNNANMNMSNNNNANMNNMQYAGTHTSFESIGSTSDSSANDILSMFN